MKKKLLHLLISFGLVLSFGVSATHEDGTCDGTAMCFAAYQDCMNQGLGRTVCINIYWACSDACAMP